MRVHASALSGGSVRRGRLDLQDLDVQELDTPWLASSAL